MATEATESNDFLKEIDDLLLDTTENGDVPSKQNHIDLAEGMEKTDVPGNEDELVSMKDTKIPEIREALDKNETVDVIHQLCANGVPDELRGDVWKSALGIKRRPDAIGTWEGPLDYENQTVIHKQCQEQAGIFSSSKADPEFMTNTLEQVVTFYCKSRNIPYKEDNGMTELLGPLATLGLTKGDLFNCLYVLLSKYIPRDCKAGGKPFDLFRLVLLYHDPELCSILDTRKLKPELYLQQWFRSLFANYCPLSVLCCLWDHYFLERDPFLMFFLALVMVINAKELILETPPTTPVEELVSMLTALPQQLTVEDIPDFVSLAQYYATRTPQSFRKDYHNLLFGSSRTLSSVNSGILCLPVHFQEIFDSLSDESPGLNYFVVDCRPLAHFSVGHLPGAIHLDTELLLHSPQDFSVSMDRLNDRVRQSKTEGGEHLCFLGSGREHEDQYMHMVVSKFLQQFTPYVSMARGGFIEMWRLLGGRANQVLEDFDVEKCKSLYEDYPIPVFASSDNNVSSHSDGSDSEGITSHYKQRLQQKSSQLYTSMSLGWRDKSQQLRVKFGEMWQTRQAATYKEKSLSLSEKKTGRRYRNLPDVFVVADDDELEEKPEEDALVNISLYSTSPEMAYSFPCEEITPSNDVVSSHLLLTSTDMIVLRESPDRLGWGRVKHRELLSTILKITAKKKDMNVIIFRLGEVEDGEAVVNKVMKLKIANSRKATDAIQQLLGNNI